MSFYTAINCMDGRIQESVTNYIKKKYNVLFVDMITSAGPVKILSISKKFKIKIISIHLVPPSSGTWEDIFCLKTICFVWINNYT